MLRSFTEAEMEADDANEHQLNRFALVEQRICLTREMDLRWWRSDFDEPGNEFALVEKWFCGGGEVGLMKREMNLMRWRNKFAVIVAVKET